MKRLPTHENSRDLRISRFVKLIVEPSSQYLVLSWKSNIRSKCKSAYLKWLKTRRFLASARGEASLIANYASNLRIPPSVGCSYTESGGDG